MCRWIEVSACATASCTVLELFPQKILFNANFKQDAITKVCVFFFFLGGERRGSLKLKTFQFSTGSIWVNTLVLLLFFKNDKAPIYWSKMHALINYFLIGFDEKPADKSSIFVTINQKNKIKNKEKKN